MSLKIIGGTFRGRILHSPKGIKTRPSSGIIRKALFDICRPCIEGSSFLDLFAGSGAIGIEAISQGALCATFVEKDPLACRCIRENIALLKIEKETSIISLSVEKALRVLSTKKTTYDIIYIDPPYGTIAIIDILKEITACSLLNQKGKVFIEEAGKNIAHLEQEKPSPLVLTHKRKYGDSYLLEYAFGEGNSSITS